jgi:hypothetical protein
VRKDLEQARRDRAGIERDREVELAAGDRRQSGVRVRGVVPADTHSAVGRDFERIWAKRPRAADEVGSEIPLQQRDARSRSGAGTDDQRGGVDAGQRCKSVDAACLPV